MKRLIVRFLAYLFLPVWRELRVQEARKRDEDAQASLAAMRHKREEEERCYTMWRGFMREQDRIREAT